MVLLLVASHDIYGVIVVSQKESLNKANELRDLSSKLKSLNVEESVEREYQLHLVEEYQRVRGVAKKAMSIMKKVSLKRLHVARQLLMSFSIYSLSIQIAAIEVDET